MKPPKRGRLVWSVAVAAVAIATAGWAFSVTTIQVPLASDAGLVIATARPAAFQVTATGLVSAANRIVERDPFRLDRQPAPLPFSPTAQGLPAPPPPPPAPPKPELQVRGILGGPPWEALLEGIPGREGSVLVRQGDTLSGLRVRRVSRDTVIVAGHDTSWTLTVRARWR